MHRALRRFPSASSSKPEGKRRKPREWTPQADFPSTRTPLPCLDKTGGFIVRSNGSWKSRWKPATNKSAPKNDGFSPCFSAYAGIKTARAFGAGGQTVKKPFREVWRAAALQMQSESGDMCGGFGSLAQQGFLTLFPAREAHRAERETVQILGKGRRRRTFSTR